MKALIAGAAATLALTFLFTTGPVDGQDKPKYSMKEIMTNGLKGGLAKKVAEGKATPAEQDLLVGYFESMHKHLPPKGSPDSWKERTKTLLDTAKSAKNDPQAQMALTKLADCMSCHKEYRVIKK